MISRRTAAFGAIAGTALAITWIWTAARSTISTPPAPIAHHPVPERTEAEAPTHASAPSEPAPTARPRKTPAPAPAVRDDEPSLMARLRGVQEADPALALELAREGNRRFPDSEDAPERASIIVHSLARLDRPWEARGEAEDMVNRYPDSHWVREVEVFTGAHRHRNAHVNADGQVEFD